MPSAVSPTVPSLQKVDFTDTAKLIAAIERDGGVIATNFTDLAMLAQVDDEVRPWLEKDKPWKGALFPPETRRCTRLIGRSLTVREKWLTRPELSAVVNHFLCKTTTNYYEDTQHTYTSYPNLSVSITMDVRPGAKGQRLHRDDKNYHVDHLDQTKTGYQRESDVGMGVLCPSVETTVENGATVVIPGSHLWPSSRAPTRAECAHACMSPGSALLFLGSLYHAGGTNSTTDQNRPMHSLFFIRGTHRQEENQYLAYSLDEVKTWSPLAQKLAGYDISQPNLGMVDFVSPVKKLAMGWDDDGGDEGFVADMDDGGVTKKVGVLNGDGDGSSTAVAAVAAGS